MEWNQIDVIGTEVVFRSDGGVEEAMREPESMRVWIGVFGIRSEVTEIVRNFRL